VTAVNTSNLTIQTIFAKNIHSEEKCFWGAECDRCESLTISPSSVSRENMGSSAPHNPIGLPGLSPREFHLSFRILWNPAEVVDEHRAVLLTVS
jgi:hypothetical protein